MTNVEMSAHAIELLRRADFAYLCTVGNSDWPHVTPVFFLFDEQRNVIYLMTARNSVKTRNILENPRVAMTIDVRDPVNPFNNRGALVEGRARTRDADSVSSRKLHAIRAQFEGKYPILKEAACSSHRDEDSNAHLLGHFAEVLMEVRILKIIYWSGGPRFTIIKLT